MIDFFHPETAISYLACYKALPQSGEFLAPVPTGYSPDAFEARPLTLGNTADFSKLAAQVLGQIARRHHPGSNQVLDGTNGKWRIHRLNENLFEFKGGNHELIVLGRYEDGALLHREIGHWSADQRLSMKVLGLNWNQLKLNYTIGCYGGPSRKAIARYAGLPDDSHPEDVSKKLAEDFGLEMLPSKPIDESMARELAQALKGSSPTPGFMQSILSAFWSVRGMLKGASYLFDNPMTDDLEITIKPRWPLENRPPVARSKPASDRTVFSVNRPSYF